MVNLFSLIFVSYGLFLAAAEEKIEIEEPCELSSSIDSNLCAFKCCTASNGSLVSNLTILVDYGSGAQPEVGYIAMQAQERYIVSIGSETNATFSNAGMLIRRDVDNDRVLASMWTPTMCVSFPVPEVCLLGSRFCPGFRLSPWPKYEHDAILDDQSEQKVARFSWRHHKNKDEVLGKIWVLKDSCMPVSIQQAVGPNLHPNTSSSSAFGESIISALGVYTSNLVQEALKNANFEVGDVPLLSDYNWAAASFSNSSSDRPDSNLFTIPARCDGSIPPPPTRSFWKGLDSLRNLATRL
jgi:hypothetical protein